VGRFKKYFCFKTVYEFNLVYNFFIGKKYIQIITFWSGQKNDIESRYNQANQLAQIHPAIEVGEFYSSKGLHTSITEQGLIEFEKETVFFNQHKINVITLLLSTLAIIISIIALVLQIIIWSNQK
jgi:hypothetical protein